MAAPRRLPSSGPHSPSNSVRRCSMRPATAAEPLHERHFGLPSSLVPARPSIAAGDKRCGYSTEATQAQYGKVRSSPAGWRRSGRGKFRAAEAGGRERRCACRRSAREPVDLAMPSPRRPGRDRAHALRSVGARDDATRASLLRAGRQRRASARCRRTPSTRCSEEEVAETRPRPSRRSSDLPESETDAAPASHGLTRSRRRNRRHTPACENRRRRSPRSTRSASRRRSPPTARRRAR